jgi:protoporphyrinogen oxidase
MKIAIIGAGITGLTAAMKLIQNGHDVTIYEQSTTPGGLGTYLTLGHGKVEAYYHHFFESDRDLIALIRELGISDKLAFYNASSAIYRAGAIEKMASPSDLLRYSHMKFIDKVRCGLIILLFKLLPHGHRSFDAISAATFIKKNMGKSAYDNLWGALLEGKFARFSKAVPTLWLWGRIHDRSPKLGYLRGSTSTLFQRMLGYIQKNGGEVRLGEAVTSIVASKHGGVQVHAGRTRRSFDCCISTVVSPITASLASSMITKTQSRRLMKIDHLAAVCLVLVLKHKVQDAYWLNICDPGMEALVLVEHTNMIDKRSYGARHVVYLANYLHKSDPRYQMTRQQIIETYPKILKRINPKFEMSWIIESSLSIAPRAQTVFKLNAQKTIPPHTLVGHKLFMANIDQMYPHDRNLNQGVTLGIKIAKIVQTQ